MYGGIDMSASSLHRESTEWRPQGNSSLKSFMACVEDETLGRGKPRSLEKDLIVRLV